MNLLVADLVSDSVSEHEAGVLVDVTAAVGLTHPSDLRQSKGATWFIHSGADVVPGGTSMVQVRSICKKGGGPALSSYKAYIVAQKGGPDPMTPPHKIP